MRRSYLVFEVYISQCLVGIDLETRIHLNKFEINAQSHWNNAAEEYEIPKKRANVIVDLSHMRTHIPNEINEDASRADNVSLNDNN